MDTVTKYMQSLLPEAPEWTKPLRAYAAEHRVPIIDELSLNVVLQFVRLLQPQRILEIGTAIGYSALRMHHVCPQAELITIEKNAHMYETALQNVKQFAQNEKIHVVFGDASDVISSFSHEEWFDFVFIDAAKSKYEQYFTLIDPLLVKNGLLIADNVLFRDYVVHPERMEVKRFKNIVQKLQRFNEQMMQHPHYHTSILPIGDGLLCSVKLT